MDNISHARMVGCHPVVIYRATALSQLVEFEVVQGYRTFNLQQAFFARGRQPLDVVNEMYRAQGLAPLTAEENQHEITKARPGFGWHEYGLAIDGAPFDAAHRIDWNASDPAWQNFLLKAKSVGFAEGADWRTFPDNPHLFPHELPSTPGDDIRQAWSEGGISAVWKLLADDGVLSLEV